MRRFIVRFSEMNSGGSYYLNNGDYNALERAGWEVNRKPGQHSIDHHNQPSYANTTVKAQSSDIALEIAITEWEHITGADRNLCICNCCGDNFYFDVDEDEDYTWEDEFEDAVREALQYDSAVQLTNIVERIAYS